MEDEEIIELFFARNEEAVKAAAEKYGALCRSISLNILRSAEDAKECVNDTMLKAWETIPPNRPKSLSAYLAAIARNIALDRYRFYRRKKRDAFLEILEEASEVFISNALVEQRSEEQALIEAINGFLEKLSSKKRRIFLSRYWLCESISAISEKNCMKPKAVYAALDRTRKELKDYLKKEGFDID